MKPYVRWRTARATTSISSSKARSKPGAETATSVIERIVVDLSGGASAYLRLMGNDYHLVAGTRDGLTIEYGGFRRGMPTVVRVFSTEPGVGRQAGLPIDITASLSQLNLNVQLEKSTFSLQLPMNVVPMTLEELNRAGPLRVPLGRR